MSYWDIKKKKIVYSLMDDDPLGDCFENREISWLKFNLRVLEEAEDKRNPLMERLNFLSIVQTNLDEFLRVRVGLLSDQEFLGDSKVDDKTFLRPSDSIKWIFKVVKKMLKRHAKDYKSVLAELEAEGFVLKKVKDLPEKTQIAIREFLKNEIQAEPIIVDKKKKADSIGGNIYAYCYTDEAVLIPTEIPGVSRLRKTDDGIYYLLEDAILMNADLWIPGEISDKALIRISRNADLNPEEAFDEGYNPAEEMEKLLERRKKRHPVRLEYDRKISDRALYRLANRLRTKQKYLVKTKRPLDLSFLFAVRELFKDRSELFYPAREPLPVPELENAPSLFSAIEKKNHLLYYPYESFDSTIRLIEEAGQDPDVTRIQMTIYRAAKKSRVIAALKEASQNGKDVRVLLEVKARFDEERNLEYGKELESSHVKVSYGFGPYKTHAKLLLIERKEKPDIALISTGNFNESTANLYTDLALFTADEKITENTKEIFEFLFSGRLPKPGGPLLIAPRSMRTEINRFIAKEMQYAKKGEPAYIACKINALTDKDIIYQLIQAGRAGVKIDLLVRGISCLRTGIVGKTDNITIRSLVGRHLEHARIYFFGPKERENVYIASADFMTRNMVRRVEAAVPVEDERLREKLHRIFDLQWNDEVKIREMEEHGQYVYLKENPDYTQSSQEKMYEELRK